MATNEGVAGVANDCGFQSYWAVAIMPVQQQAEHETC